MSLDLTKKINRVVVDGTEMAVVGVPHLQDKEVTPTKEIQTVRADEGYDGLGTVGVGAIQTEDRTFTQNGIYTPSSGKFIDKVVVDVADIPAVLQEKTISPAVNNQEVLPDSGYEGISKLTVLAVTSDIDSNIKEENIKDGVTILGKTGTLKEGITPEGTLPITENGDYDVSNYAWASVNVEPNLTTKEITENGTYKASDDGADGYSEVVVNVASGGGGYPIEVSTDTDMTNALVEDNLGKVYKFTGTSDTYETDAIYIVSEV